MSVSQHHADFGQFRGAPLTVVLLSVDQATASLTNLSITPPGDKYRRAGSDDMDRPAHGVVADMGRDGGPSSLA